jgi:uncharacterized protein YodC (DUF2158 family)
MAALILWALKFRIGLRLTFATRGSNKSGACREMSDDAMAFNQPCASDETAVSCYCSGTIRRTDPGFLPMTTIKSGDLVVLKSGGPTMTVDTVNTDIFDDNKVTGILCVWFVGEKLERVRFDHRAIEPAPLQRTSPVKEGRPEDATGEYKVVLDEMAAAMNIPADADKDTLKPAVKRPKRVAAPKYKALAASPVVAGVAT